MEHDLDMKQRKEDEKKGWHIHDNFSRFENTGKLGFNRFDAVFNSLVAEIEGLPNDEEDDDHDDQETAQGTDRLNTTHSMRTLENNSISRGKTNYLSKDDRYIFGIEITEMDEEIEFTKRTTKTEADQYDLDLKEEDDIPTTKMNRIQGKNFGKNSPLRPSSTKMATIGSNFESLETLVNSMQPDSFEEEGEIRPMPTTKIIEQKGNF